MKKICMISLSFILIVCMLGCSSLKSEESVIEWTTINSREITMEIWAWDETFNIKAVNLAVEKYRKKYPEIYIRVVTKEKNEILQKLENVFSAHEYEELPDIVLVEDYDIQKLLSAYAEEFVPLDSVLDYDQYQDYKTELVSKDGVHYGLPFDSGAAVMFYRKDYIEAAGYTEEDMQNITWEKYREIGNKVKEKTGVHMLTVQPDDLGIIRIMMQSAGRWYVDESGKNVDIVDNEVLKEALRIYEAMMSENLTLPTKSWDDFTAAFQTGKVATVVSGCWIAPTIRQNTEQKGMWRVAPIPCMENIEESVPASNIGGSSWYVLNHKENKEEAAKFLKETFGENKELLNELVKEIDFVSTRKDAAEFPAYQEKETFFGDTNIFQVFLDTTTNVPIVNYGSNTYEIEDILEDELQVFLKEKNLDSSLKKVQTRAQMVIE